MRIGMGCKTSEERLVEAVKQGLAAPQDVEMALEFVNFYSTTRGLTNRSRNKYLWILRSFLQEVHRLGHTVANMSQQEAVALIQFLQTSPWTEPTRVDCWDRFKRFYGWAAKKHGPWNDEVRKLLVGEERYVYRIDKNKLQRKDTMTPEEVLQIVHMESDLAYKTFFAVMYETGMRSEEGLTLKIKDVKKHSTGSGYDIRLRASKTMKRTVPVVHFSALYLTKWLKMHPSASNSEAPLFVNTFNEPLQNPTANKRLRQIVRKVGITDRTITLHCLRHSRATELAKVLTEFQMCSFFGWSMGSDMPRTYIREDALDLRGALMKAYGMETAAAPHEIKGRTCLHCTHLNPFDAEYCDNCSLPLDAGRLEKLKETVDGAKMEVLLKKTLRQMRASIIEEVRKELGPSGVKAAESGG